MRSSELKTFLRKLETEACSVNKMTEAEIEEASRRMQSALGSRLSAAFIERAIKNYDANLTSLKKKFKAKEILKELR